MTYCDFQVGDQVVCIQSCQTEPILTHEGEIYTIIEIALDGRGDPSLRFAGIFNGSGKACVTGAEYRALSLAGAPFCGFNPDRFRKVNRRDIGKWLEQSTDFEEPKRAPAKETA